jgi:hypothetical protein
MQKTGRVKQLFCKHNSFLDFSAVSQDIPYNRSIAIFDKIPEELLRSSPCSSNSSWLDQPRDVRQHDASVQIGSLGGW